MSTPKQYGRAEKGPYEDVETGELLLPPKVEARKVVRYKLVSKDAFGNATYQSVGIETLSWPIDNED